MSSCRKTVLQLLPRSRKILLTQLNTKLQLQRVMNCLRLTNFRKQKIDEIDNRLASVEKQKQVEAFIKDGDAALTKKDLAAARGKYQQALTLDPGNTIAAAKMQEVVKLENDL